MVEVIGTFFLLASAISANKVLLRWIAPTFFVGIRMLTAGCLSVALDYYRMRTISWEHIRADMGMLVRASVLTTGIPSLLKAYGLRSLFSAKVTLLGSIDPFVAALYDYLFFGQRLSMTRLIGMMLGFVGVVILLTHTSSAAYSWAAWFHIAYPELAVISGVFVLRYGWYLMQQLVRTHHYTPLRINGITMIISGVLTLLLAWFSESQWLYQGKMTIGMMVLFAYTVVIGNIAGYGCYAYLLKKHSATYVSLFGFSIPVFVSLIGWLLLGEPITDSLIIAGSIMGIGMYLFYTHEMKV